MPYKKGPGVSVLAIGDMFSANGGKNRPNTVLSGEMVTFLLSQAVSILILIICRHPPGYTPSEINILQQRLRAGGEGHTKSVFLRISPGFLSIVVEYYNFLSCVRIRRSHATLFMMNKFMFCRLKKWEITKSTFSDMCIWKWTFGEWEM